MKKKYTLIFNKIADTKTGCGVGLLLSLEVQVADLKWGQSHQDGWWRMQKSEGIPDLICSLRLLGGLS